MLPSASKPSMAIATVHTARSTLTGATALVIYGKKALAGVEGPRRVSLLDEFQRSSDSAERRAVDGLAPKWARRSDLGQRRPASKGTSNAVKIQIEAAGGRPSEPRDAKAGKGQNFLSEAERQRGEGITGYTASMAASIPDKLKEILRAIDAAELDRERPLTMVEVGCANGATTASLSAAMRQAGYKNLEAIGFDIAKSYATNALRTFGPNYEAYPGLKFHWLAASEAWPFKPNVAVMSSVLHEIESYTEPKDNRDAVPKFLEDLHEGMPVGGIGVLRDFVAPANGEGEAIVYHRDADVKTIVSKGGDLIDDGKPLTFPYLVERFKASGGPGTRASFWCQPLDPTSEGLPVKEGWTAYATNRKSAYRFVFGKDYHEGFTAEMNENYAFATAERYTQMVEKAGFEIFYRERNPGDWIQQNRLEGNIEIYTKTPSGDWERHDKLPFDYQTVIGFRRTKPKRVTTLPQPPGTNQASSPPDNLKGPARTKTS